jgi:hypothetical protein
MSDGLQLNDPRTLYRRWEESQWSPYEINLAPSSQPSRSTKPATCVLRPLPRRGRRRPGRNRRPGRTISPRGFRRVPPAVRRCPRRSTRATRRGPRRPDRQGPLRNPLPPDPRSHLGLTSFKFITDYLNDNELLPGFVEGYSKIHHDETRHIGCGVWFLRETVRARPEQADTIRQTLRELLPHAADSLKLPADGDASELLGIKEEDLRTFALGGLTRRLSIIGVPIETVLA